MGVRDVRTHNLPSPKTKRGARPPLANTVRRTMKELAEFTAAGQQK